MATAALPVMPADRIDRLSGTPRAGAIDRWIYVVMAVLFISIVLAGFIPDSIDKLNAVAEGRRPSFPLVLHLHAVLMGSFLALLLAQTWLAATGRIGRHQQLGLASAIIVPALVVVGFILAPVIYQETAQALQTAPAGTRDKVLAVLARKENILLNQIRMGVLFPLFIVIGARARQSEPGLHKRMMILATATVLGPAIVRIPSLPTTFPVSPLGTELYILAALAPMFVWDSLRNGYVHRAYLIWLGITVPCLALTYALWNTPWWHAAARGLLS